MPPVQQPHTLLYLLKRAYLASRALADDSLTAHGLSIAQYAALRRLEDQPGLSGAELARRCSVTAPTMNELLASLEGDGLIERAADPQGGRSILARLTPSGRQAVTNGRAVVDHLEDLLLAPLDAADRGALLDALETIAEGSESRRLPVGVA